jgi:hypothetical protein
MVARIIVGTSCGSDLATAAKSAEQHGLEGGSTARCGCVGLPPFPRVPWVMAGSPLNQTGYCCPLGSIVIHFNSVNSSMTARPSNRP